MFNLIFVLHYMAVLYYHQVPDPNGGPPSAPIPVMAELQKPIFLGTYADEAACESAKTLTVSQTSWQPTDRSVATCVPTSSAVQGNTEARP